MAGALSLAWMTLPHAGEFELSNKILANIEQQYGNYARQRILYWRNLINSNQNIDEALKLQIANDFINKLEFVSDIDHWGQEDYWATPLQMLSSNAGDCEDFSIAKYFTLREMGIPAERMRLTYVKALKLNQAHMVLTYYPTPDADPLILDNLVDDIRRSSDRKDLLPVYSFNGNSLWLAKSRGMDQHIGQSKRLSRWQGVIARINNEQIPLSH
ncbi:MAG: transglutaminase-like cysteine peptidase [Gammaproteobacteria bacterium]|nr:transglutaminase-like cysteine peptidase [Gammaproteobacteria bacterium]